MSHNSSSAGSPVVLLVEGKLSVLVYLKIVLCCSVLFMQVTSGDVTGLQ